MKLILNRHAREGEVFISGDQPIAQIRAAWESATDYPEDVDVCTFSPIVAGLWEYEFRGGGGFAVMCEDTRFFDGERDRMLTDFCSLEWMVHFRLADLYMRGEFAERGTAKR